MSSPLDQFNITDWIKLSVLNDINISITNIGFYIILSVILSIVFNIMSNNQNSLNCNGWSLCNEAINNTIHSITVNQISSSSKGQSFFPFIYSLFIFILISNLIGMIPYNFSSTSHFILTFFFSFSIVLGATYLSLYIHKLKFFSLFVPSGCPLGLLVLLVLIEFISYLARNISLGLRLAANVLSGHMLLNILSGFTYKIMINGILYFLLSLLPLMFIIAFSALELAIAFIQAQVFVVLSGSYIRDGLYLH